MIAERRAQYGEQRKDVLYTEFCRQLVIIGEGGELKRRDVERRLGLVPSQVRTWLERAGDDGTIRWTSKKPARFMVSETISELDYDKSDGNRRMTMDKRGVSSSTIVSIGYDPKRETLEIEFRERPCIPVLRRSGQSAR